MAASAPTDTYAWMMLPGSDPEGRPIFAVLAKRRFHIVPGKKCEPAAEQSPLTPATKYFDKNDPTMNSTEVETDLYPYKPMTDVVFTGKAYAPGGRPVAQCLAGIRVGNLEKSVAVFGERRCAYNSAGAPIFTNPAPFETMEIRYERAYGGVDIHADPNIPMAYPRNFVGTGFVVKATKEAVEGLRLPNIEDPADLLTPQRLITGSIEKWHKQPVPAGLGWYGLGWYPRASFAGVLPAFMPMYEELHEMTLGVVPKDQVEAQKKLKLPKLDFRLFNGASPGLAAPHMAGNETIQLRNLEPSGNLTFQLPGQTPVMTIDYGRGVQKPPVVLHTVAIFGETMVLDLVWRGSVVYEGAPDYSDLTRLDVTVTES